MVSWHPQGHRSAADQGWGDPKRYIVRAFKHTGISGTRWMVQFGPRPTEARKSAKRLPIL